MRLKQQLPSLITSVIFHGVILGAMGMMTYAVDKVDNAFVIETVVADEERERDEVEQKLDEQQEIAETVNFVAGGPVSNALGGSEAPLSQQQKIELEDVAREPDITVNASITDIPGPNLLTNDLGPGEVTGEVGAVVEGYGPALDRLTQELMRLMREHKLTVVWLFDESESMKDDQQELRQRLYRVYEELKLVETDEQAAGGRKKKLQDVLETVICSYGAGLNQHTPKPTSDLNELMAAIDNIPIDRTGLENTCQAINAMIAKYRGVVANGRKLVVVVVSDESGDDGENVESVIEQARQVKCPVYIMGRESVFGSFYAYVRWKHPDTGHIHHLPIRRGPETPFAENLQFDGFGRRTDAHMSGFGPYEQVRISRETGGIFFQLPHEEEDLHNLDNRKNENLSIREYLPSLESRRVYAEGRDKSKFRAMQWQVISILNPYDPKLEKIIDVPTGWIDRDPAVFPADVKQRMERILVILGVLHQADTLMEEIRPLRDEEPSLRWRANYDLMRAQLFAYKVRLFQYAIALDQFAQEVPNKGRFKNPKSNRWSVSAYQRTMLNPTEKQQAYLKFTADDLKEAHQKALQQLAMVQEMHPGTPWARRAEYELKRNFGVAFAEHTHIPPPPPKPGEKPKPVTPPPKL